jgi:hypothetical protein
MNKSQKIARIFTIMSVSLLILPFLILLLSVLIGTESLHGLSQFGALRLVGMFGTAITGFIFSIKSLRVEKSGWAIAYLVVNALLGPLLLAGLLVANLMDLGRTFAH